MRSGATRSRRRPAAPLRVGGPLAALVLASALLAGCGGQGGANGVLGDAAYVVTPADSGTTVGLTPGQTLAIALGKGASASGVALRDSDPKVAAPAGEATTAQDGPVFLVHAASPGSAEVQVVSGASGRAVVAVHVYVWP